MAKGKHKRERSAAPPAKYTEQVVLLISKDARAVIDIAVREHPELSQASAARAFLYAGMRAAGYHDLKTTDEAANLGKAEQVAEMIEEAAHA